MSINIEQSTNKDLWSRAEEIVEKYSDSSYAENYQVTYNDQAYLTEAVHELLTTEPVTNRDNIDKLKSELAQIACGGILKPIIITGRCAETVSMDGDLSKPTKESLLALEVVESEIPGCLNIRRERGQNTKPRSEETEVIDNSLGKKDIVFSYMGDSINDLDPSKRTPDPGRLVSAALQARDVEHELVAATGSHVLSAHEALNLYYEESFIKNLSETKYLVSADLPWIGMRTNQPDSDQVNMLSNIENPIGIKLGDSSTPQQIQELVKKLNPKFELGKLVFMLRFGTDKIEDMKPVLEAIRELAPGSLVMYDIHGSTIKKKIQDGDNVKTYKVRSVEDIITEIRLLSAATKAAGLVLHGLHLEVRSDYNSHECVETNDQLPLDQPDVDPQLNLDQLKTILTATKDYLL